MIRKSVQRFSEKIMRRQTSPWNKSCGGALPARYHYSDLKTPAQGAGVFFA
jgi:hypothetical protein